MVRTKLTVGVGLKQVEYPLANENTSDEKS